MCICYSAASWLQENGCVCICYEDLGPRYICLLLLYLLLGTPKKNMTARDVTAFWLLFSPPGDRAIFSTFWGDFLTKLDRKAGEKGENPLEKNQKNPVETASRNCRFLSLVVVGRCYETHN